MSYFSVFASIIAFLLLDYAANIRNFRTYNSCNVDFFVDFVRQNPLAAASSILALIFV